MDMTDGLPKVSILSILATNTDLFVGTRGDAVWRRALSDFNLFNVVDRSEAGNVVTVYIRIHSHNLKQYIFQHPDQVMRR